MKQNSRYIPASRLISACRFCLDCTVLVLESTVVVGWMVFAVYGLIICLFGADGSGMFGKTKAFGVGIFTGAEKLLLNVVDAHPVFGFILYTTWYLTVGTFLLHLVFTGVVLAIRIYRSDREQLRKTAVVLWREYGKRLVSNTRNLFDAVIHRSTSVALMAFCAASLLGLIVFVGNLLLHDKSTLDSFVHAESCVRHVCLNVGAGLRGLFVFLPGFIRRHPAAAAATGLVLFRRFYASVLQHHTVQHFSATER